jgi:DNA-binding transcriptional regulator LsrR (DeoR family)
VWEVIRKTGYECSKKEENEMGLYADVNATYTDANGNTVSATIHHPGIAMSLADLDNMRDHVRAGDEPWNTAFLTFAADPQSRPNPRKQLCS